MDQPINFTDLNPGDALVIGTEAGNRLLFSVRDRYISTSPHDDPSSLTAMPVHVGPDNGSFDMEAPVTLFFAEVHGDLEGSLPMFTLASKAMIQEGDAFMLAQTEPIGVGRMTSVHLERATSMFVKEG